MLTPALTYVDIDDDNDSFEVGVDTPPITGHHKMPPLDMRPVKPTPEEVPAPKQEEKPAPSECDRFLIITGCEGPQQNLLNYSVGVQRILDPVKIIASDGTSSALIYLSSSVIPFE